jgi:hypothetical protein
VFDPFEFTRGRHFASAGPRDRREDKVRRTPPVDAAGIDTDEPASRSESDRCPMRSARHRPVCEPDGGQLVTSTPEPVQPGLTTAAM